MQRNEDNPSFKDAYPTRTAGRPPQDGPVWGVRPKDYDDYYACKNCGFGGCREATVSVSQRGDGNSIATASQTIGHGGQTWSTYTGTPTVGSGCPHCGSHNSR